LLELLEGDLEFVTVAELILKLGPVRDSTHATAVPESDVVVAR